MSQYDFGNLESPLSGTAFINSHIEPWRDAIHSSHAGNSRPSYAVGKLVWVDTTTTPWAWKMFDGADDIILGYINASTNTFIPGGTILNNLSASTNPTVNDDSDDGYSVGSLWINTTLDTIYILVDATPAGASWRLIIDSTGTQTMSAKTLTNPTINASGGTIVLPQGSSPAQTAEGQIFWDTDDDVLTVGTSAGRKVMCDTNSTQTLTNKTLTSPAINGAVIDNTSTMQAYRPSTTYTANTVASLGDGGQTIYMDVGSANTYTLPQNSTVAFPIGTEIEVVQLGAGQTSFVAGSGATIVSADSYLKIGKRYAGAVAKKYGTNAWLIIGNLAA